jgi:hypothetical protein
MLLPVNFSTKNCCNFTTGFFIDSSWETIFSEALALPVSVEEVGL